MTSWLAPQGILLDVDATDVAALVSAAIPALATLSGIDRAVIARALGETMREATAAIGSGIAVPHAPIAGLSKAAVVLVRLTSPIDMRAIDHVPVDLIFVTLFPAENPTGHLAFLAHLAQMVRSRVFRDGLRSATRVSDVLELVDAAELRRAITPPGIPAAAPPGIPAAASPAIPAVTSPAIPAPPAIPPAPSTSSLLALISLAGEKAVDAVLVGLIEAGFGEATIVDAQSASEAASREVPLFAAFQDIFGDPGGRRLILVSVSEDQMEPLTNIIRRACEEWKAVSGEVSFVPVVSRWKWTRSVDPPPSSGGH